MWEILFLTKHHFSVGHVISEVLLISVMKVKLVLELKLVLKAYTAVRFHQTLEIGRWCGGSNMDILVQRSILARKVYFG